MLASPTAHRPQSPDERLDSAQALRCIHNLPHNTRRIHRDGDHVGVLGSVHELVGAS